MEQDDRGFQATSWDLMFFFGGFEQQRWDPEAF
jgi:hypothetical protein